MPEKGIALVQVSAESPIDTSLLAKAHRHLLSMAQMRRKATIVNRMVLTTGRHPAALRDDVTTPAGCTIAGLLMLEDGRIRSVLARAVEEATKTSAHLGVGPTKISESGGGQRSGN